MLSNNLLQNIRQNLVKYKDVEVEFRFGSISREGRYIGGVSRRTYDRMSSVLSSFPYVEENTEDFINGSLRRRDVIGEEGSGKFIVKDTLLSFDSSDYPFRLVISREKEVAPPPSFTYKLTRRKHRRSYFIYSGNFRVDLTRVEEISDQVKPLYEVEMEVLSSSFDATQLLKALTFVLSTLLDTHYLYTEQIRKKLLASINKVLGGETNEGLDSRILMQSRNLKLQDMVWGGLIGNPSTSYSVTHKADGIRKLLVFHPSGIFLILPPYEVTMISASLDSSLIGTILDGEVIPLESRKEGAPATKYWYLAFDCLSFPYPTSATAFDTSVQRKTLNERLRACQVVADRNKNALLHINTKEFHNFSSPEGFYKRMRSMFAAQEGLGYRQDGFIFTPLNVPYNPRSSNFPLNKRILTDIPDNCKWKPADQLTIDLSLQWSSTPEGNKVARVFTTEVDKKTERRRFVQFTGTKRYPLAEVVKEGINSIPSNTILEFKVQGDSLIPIKVREKRLPNAKDIAIDVWQDAHNPLLQDTLTGDDFILVRRYHNKIKRDLLEKLPSGSSLLDLGSGQGGDISKWSHLSVVYAVEPSQERRAEMERRLTSLGYRRTSTGVYKPERLGPEIHILPFYAQDTEEITSYLKQPVDAVSTLLSMTFFWQSPQILASVISTIRKNLKEDGTLLFLTIDGNAVKETFEPERGIPLNALQLGQNLITYDSSSDSITLNFPGLIIDKQTEPLVYLEDLSRDFSLEVERADKEKFLSAEEAIFSNLYVYGSGKLLPQSAPIERLSPLPYHGEDTIEPLTLAWQEGVLRVATTKDNSLLSALLKAFYPEYRDAETEEDREEIITNVKGDLINRLAKVYYQIDNGALAALAQNDDHFSLPYLTLQIREKNNLGTELYSFVAESLELDIYVISAATLSPYFYTGKEQTGVVLLLHPHNRVELLALEYEDEVFTTFDVNDPFLSEIRKMVK